MKAAVAILLMTGLNAAGVRMAPEVIANVSMLLARYNDVDCLQIFRTDDLPLPRLEAIYKTWKTLATVETRMTTGVYSYKRYLQRKTKSTRKVSCYRSLKIMSDDEESRTGYSEFTQKVSLKDAIWVLFTDSLSVSFFRDAHIVFNDLIIVAVIKTEDVVLLHEVYRVNREFPLKVLSLGNWTRAAGLSHVKESMYERRSDLQGIVLRTASVQNWPASYKTDGEWKGFLVKIWEEIRTLINCSSVDIEAENMVGMRLDNGSWNGLVGMAIRDEIDVLVTEVVINKERSHALAFLHPIIKSSFQIYTRHLGYQWQWEAIMKPFHRSVWAAAFAWLIVATAAWAFFHSVCSSRGLEPFDVEELVPMRSFFFVTQALSQQGYHWSPSSYACRVLFFVSYAVSSVLIPSYSASLVSTLSQEVHLKSFDSLQDMVEDGSYRLLVKQNTAQDSFFAHSKDGFLKLAYEKLIKPVPEEMRKMGVRQSIKSLCYLDKYAVMGVENVIDGRLHYLLTLDCPIVHLTHPVSTIYITMATSKNSPFRGLINHHLGKLLMSGIVERLRRLEFPFGHSHLKESKPEVGLRQLVSAFVFMGLCTLLAILLLLLEIQYVYYRSRRTKKMRKKRKGKVKGAKGNFPFELKRYNNVFPSFPDFY